MPTYCITIINEHFNASHEYDLPTLEVARSEALKSALQIGASEVHDNSQFFAAEVNIDLEGERVGRMVVSIGTSSLSIK